MPSLIQFLIPAAKKSIPADGVLTEAVLPKYKPPSIINSSRGRGGLLVVPTEAMKRKQVLGANPFLGEVLDSKGQQALL